jgi:hypothetical protein
MPVASSFTRRRATSFSAINVGTQPRKTSATSAGPQGPDFHNAAASLTRLDKGTVSVPSPGAIAAGGVAEVTVTLVDAIASATLDGATQSDLIILNAPVGLEAGLDIGSERITALNTLKFRIFNTTAGPITPATATYSYFLVRS